MRSKPNEAKSTISSIQVTGRSFDSNYNQRKKRKDNSIQNEHLSISGFVEENRSNYYRPITSQIKYPNI